MPPSIYCITGRVKLKTGQWCQECNGFHLADEEVTPPLRISIRTVAHMLHDEEISAKEAAMTLFLLTQEKTIQRNHRHD